MTYRPPKIVRTLLAALAAMALVTTSCGGGSDTAVDTASPASAPTESDAPQAEAFAPQATEAPADESLIATTVGGGQIDFGSLEGQDVVLWFWAPW